MLVFQQGNGNQTELVTQLHEECALMSLIP
jgi:hypothetical protein